MKEAMQSQVLRVQELVGYQQDAIVSKVLLDSEKGSITMFSFDDGQRLSEHTAPFDAVVYLLEGQAEITIGETNYCLTAGDMIIMPAHKPHAVYASEKFKMMLTLIKS